MKLEWLLRLYPRRWRRRYQEEFLALLEQQALGPGILLDIIVGAIDAHVRMQLAAIKEFRMQNIYRSTALAVFCAYMGFVIAGLGFHATLDDSPFISLSHTHPVLSFLVLIVQIGAVAALLAVLIGGWPIVQAALKDAARSAHRNLPLFAVPVLFAVALGIGLVLLIAIANGYIPASHFAAEILFLSLVGLFFIAIVTSTASICIAVARSKVRVSLYRFALVPGTVAAISMGVMLMATSLWGVCALLIAPEQFLHGHFGALGASTAASWVLIVALMLVTTGMAAAALLQAFNARPDDTAPC